MLLNTSSNQCTVKKRMWGILIFVIIHIGFISSNHSLCNFCECQKTTVDCRHRNLTTVPKITSNFVEKLLLGQKEIKDIPDNIFNGTRLRILDLSENNLTWLCLSSFNGLESLTSLRLQANRIKLNESSYPAGVFRSLKSLEYLDLSSNDDASGDQSFSKYPDKALSELISLKVLKLDGIPDFVLSGGFSHLKNLTSLVFTGNCNISCLKDNTFENVSQISNLILRFCSIHSISNSTFSVFHRLYSLDLSYNQDLTLDGASRALQSLTSSYFRVLDITSVVKTFAVGVIVDKAFFSENTTLKHNGNVHGS